MQRGVTAVRSDDVSVRVASAMQCGARAERSADMVEMPLRHLTALLLLTWPTSMYCSSDSPRFYHAVCSAAQAHSPEPLSHSLETEAGLEAEGSPNIMTATAQHRMQQGGG
eukprot:3012673-Rhodomonas_salina.2